MILDTSALVAIPFETPEVTRCWSGKPDAARQAEAFLRAAAIVEEPVTLQQGALTGQAFYYFGRGRHRARLNFGDCFAYALSKAMNEPLLFKGHDFVKTDVQVAHG